MVIQPEAIRLARRKLLRLGGMAALGLQLQGPALALLARRRQPREVGFLAPGSQEDQAFALHALLAGLRELGHVEDQDFTMVYRFAGEDEAFVRVHVAGLVGRRVAVIVASGIEATIAAQIAVEAARSDADYPPRPTVMVVGVDPISAGIVDSLDQPEHPFTGVSFSSTALNRRRLELLREALPGLERVAVLWDRNNPVQAPAQQELEAVARSMGLQLQAFVVQRPDDLQRAYDAAHSGGANAVLVCTELLAIRDRSRLTALALQHRLPTMHEFRESVDAGGLMAYGPRLADMYRRAAAYVDQALRGAKPVELPVEQVSAFELTINSKTAQAMGLTIPQHVLAQTTAVVQ